jgi:CheY-like chemotaxis protein
MHEPKRGLRILVVDDNYDGATMLSALLELMGHRTSTVYNGLEAVHAANRDRYDVVLLDLGMPNMDGFEAAAILSQLRPAPMLIACSGWYDCESRKRTTELGFAAHLRKPVGFEALEAALELASFRPDDEASSVWGRGHDGDLQGVAHPNELG